MALKKKNESQKAPFGVLNRLAELAPNFRTKTFADVQRIDKLLRTLSEGLAPMYDRNAEIFKQFDIPETEIVDASHPLYNQVNEAFREMQAQFSEVKKESIACLSQKQAEEAIKGADLNYMDMKLIQSWLIIND